MEKNLEAIRKQYRRDTLDERQVHPDPYAQFDRWLSDAISAGVPEPTAMSLSTIGEGCRPASRMVLLKGSGAGGYVFFTNYESRKGRDLDRNPAAALLFYWPELERQVRIEGMVKKADPENSDAYFMTRPLASRISAVVSPQSREIPGRDWLVQKRQALCGGTEVFDRGEERLQDQADPQYVEPGSLAGANRPQHWGGYLLVPDYYEFWQGREDRLHDRIAYEPSGNGWRIFRLAP